MKRVTSISSSSATVPSGAVSGWNYNEALGKVVQRIVRDYKGDNVKFFADMRAEHGLQDLEVRPKKAVAKS